MAAPMANMLNLTLRGSQGVWVTTGPPDCKFSDTFPGSRSNRCRCMTYSDDGSKFAYSDGNMVQVVNTSDEKLVAEIDQPRGAAIVFSPTGSRLAVWEPFTTAMAKSGQTTNLHIYDASTGALVKSLCQKKQSDWCPQWTKDESVMARLVNNEVHFHENNNLDAVANKLHLQKVQSFFLTSKARRGPYHVACYMPGSKGQASTVRIFQYPNFGASSVNSKSFYKADKVDVEWNPKGTALVVLTATEVSEDSYFGEQGLHFMDVKGESSLVPRPKNGPVYSVQWTPYSNEFCVVYGFMPAKATLFNHKCEPVFDFGTGPRNVVHFNPMGNIMALAGFGNLRGNIEMWDMKQKKLISQPKAPDSTSFEWAPDGVHWMTATTSPRLRVGNGFKIWHYTGTLMYESSVPSGQELWEARWQPAEEGVFPEQRISYKPIEGGAATPAQPETVKRYVPPAMRNLPESQQVPAGGRYRHDDFYEKPQNLKQANPENMSKQALKNKKKRDARKAKAQQEAEEPEPAAAAPPGGRLGTNEQTTGDADKDKKIRNVKKKLQQIEKLKEKQAAGETLEKNQLDKMSTESALLKELQSLTL